MAAEKSVSKRDEINRRLAEYFIAMEPGLNIDSVRDLSASLDASIGLISESISTLEESGAIRIERRGQLGSYLLGRSIGKLWDLSRGEPLVIAHTLPSNRRYEGLATALKTIFQREGVDVYFIFIRGSKTRLNALKENRCHIAIVSQFAAEGLKTRREELAKVLPAGSFAKSHQVFLRADLDKKKPSLDVAIDTDSYDQSQLSNIEFKDDPAIFQRITFMNIRHYLASRKIDAAIWTEEDMEGQMGDEIIKRPLSPSTLEVVNGRNTKAALVVRGDDLVTCRLVSKLLDEVEVCRIQQAVIKGEIIPEY